MDPRPKAFHESISRHVNEAFPEERFPSNFKAPAITPKASGMSALASALYDRKIKSRDFRQVLSKAQSFVTKPSELRTFLGMLAGDVNLVHSLQHTPAAAVPRSFTEFSDESARAKWISKAVLSRIGVPQSDWHLANSHGTWADASRELPRYLASHDYLDNERIQTLLKDSFYNRHHAYANLPQNNRARQDLLESGVHYSVWLSEPFKRLYDSRLDQVKASEGVAREEALKNFFSLARQFQRVVPDGSHKLASALSAGTGQKFDAASAKALVASGESFASRGTPLPPSARFSTEQLNPVLLGMISKVQTNLLTRSDPRITPAGALKELNELDSNLVALQRVVAPHDEALTLREGSTIRQPEVSYSIAKQKKDPVFFLTGGNDSGVCDSTMDKARFRRADLALKTTYQEAAIFRHFKSRPARRIGQVRMYAGKDSEGRPTLLVNSIDLEAEARLNLGLYRTAVDYVRDYARACNFQRVLIGRHADMALKPFENHDLFSDLKRVEEHVSLIDHFPEKQGFHDFFTDSSGPNYEKKSGRAQFYEVPL